MNDQSKFWPPWAIADLAKSGLTVEQVEAVGWAMVPPQDYAGHLGFAIPGAPEAYAIPFRDPVTGEPMKTSSGRPYVRLKFERPVHLGEKSAKYMSPQGSGNRAYIPREAHEAAARGEPLLLTEGEKKALCACRNNLPCIGLVGVYGYWDSATQDLLDELKRYFIAGRQLTCIVDSDAWCNMDIVLAAKRLSHIASLRGCLFKVLVLPPSVNTTDKVGLDDAIVEQGADHVRHKLLPLAKLAGGNADDLYIDWLRDGLAARMTAPYDPAALVGEILRKGYFDRLSGACRRRVDEALKEATPDLVRALSDELHRLLGREFDGVPVPTHGGQGIAHNRFVRAPGCEVALKVDAIAGDIVWCFLPNSEQRSRPYPKTLLEAAERPSSSAQNGQLGGRPGGFSPTDITNAFLAQNMITEGGLCKLRILRGQWYLWRETRYVKISERDVRAIVMAFLRQHPVYSGAASTRTLTDVMNQLCAADTCALSSATTLPIWLAPGGIQPADGWVAMKNGAVNIENLVRVINGKTIPDEECYRPASPSLMTPYVQDYVFDPGADCFKFIGYLHDVQPDPEARRLLQMMAGLCLVPDTRYNAMFILDGEAGTGKSVFLYVLGALVGAQNACHVPFAKLCDKFSVGALTENLLNLIGEGDTELPRDVGLGRVEGLLKDITDGGLLPVERKYQEPCSARATARLVAACNGLPTFYDRSDGLWDRLRVIPFEQRMRGTAKDNTTLRYEIVAEELPGVFMWAVRGLAELRRLKTFPELKAGEERKRMHRQSCDHEREFLDAACVYDPASSVPTQGLYCAYKTWMSARGYHALGEARFSASVRRLFPEVHKTRQRTPDGKQPHVYNGLALVEGVA